MDQEKIWEVFQNEENFSENFPEARQRYVLRGLFSGTRVLNIGVGSGVLEKLGIEKGVQMYSLDPSKKAIQRLKEELSMGANAQAGYAQSMPFEDGTFDAVVMSEVIEHLDDEVLASSLDEVLRVLRPGGFIFATTPYLEKLSGGRVICPGCGESFHRMGHLQSFDKTRIHEILTSHKFREIRTSITTFVDWRRSGVKNTVKSLLRLALAKMGESIADPHLVVKAKK